MGETPARNVIHPMGQKAGIPLGQQFAIAHFHQTQWLQGLLLLALLSGSTAVRVIDGRWDIIAEDMPRIVIMLILLPGIVSRRPGIHAVQMIFPLLVALLALQRIVAPIGGSAQHRTHPDTVAAPA